MGVLIGLTVLLVGMQSHAAGKCVMHVVREACPGKEGQSYTKCGDKKECDQAIEATSEKDCAKKARKECDNARVDITKSKAITAIFDGKPVEAGKNFCAADAPSKCK